MTAVASPSLFNRTARDWDAEYSARILARVLGRDESSFLAAMDSMVALNAFVRSGVTNAWNAREAIYSLKRAAITECQARGINAHRRVAIDVTCRDCRGTGRYETRYGDKRDHCWACNSTGTAILRFVETTISLAPGRTIIWHSPWTGFPSRLWVEGSYGDDGSMLLNEDGLTWESAGDWAPNQKSEPLELVPLVQHLNVVEEYFSWDFRNGTPEPYELYVGEPTPCRCALCGLPEVEGVDEFSRFRRRIGLIEWTGQVCSACYDRYDAKSLFKTAMVPECVYHEPIASWIRRHNAWQTIPRPQRWDY